VTVGYAFYSGLCAGVRRCVRHRCGGISSVCAARIDAAVLAPDKVGRCRNWCGTSAVEDGERNRGPEVNAGLKRIAVALGLIIVLVPAGYYLWRWYDRSREVQTTNDAYVRGEITEWRSKKLKRRSIRPRPIWRQ